MDRHSTPQQLQRLRELAQELGAIPQDELITLSPPRQRPTFRGPDDERKAEAVLGQLKIEASQNGTRPKGLRRAFSTIGSGKNTSNYTYEGVNAALTRVVEENGLAGVAEVLLTGFKQLGGDINIARRASNGLIKKIRNADSPEERGHLLETATENSRLDFVQLLAPDADQPSLNESLNIALQNKNPEITQTLLQYGANSTVQQQAFEAAARNGNVQMVNLMLRAPRRVPEHCVTRSLLPAVMSGSLPVVLQLLQAGANGNYDGASALMFAVEASRLDLVAAILASHNPPSPPMVNDALDSALSVPSSILVERYTLAELLLCSGPHGDAANEGLVKATVLSNVKMMQLFLNHRSDINYNNGCAIANAMQRNRADLVGILLQDQDLRPDVASELVGRIARTAPPEDRIALLSKLLINGASGVHCNEQLIIAAAQNDIETARILVMHGKEEHTPVVSVDYNAAKALETAVSQNNLPLVKILALEGSPSEFSLSKAFASMPKLTGDQRYLMVQTLLRAGARGAEVDSFLRAAIASQEKSKRLIDLLVQFGAEVDDETLLATVSQGNVDILQILLSKNGSVTACSAAVPVAMRLPIGQARYRIVKLLVVNITAAGADNSQIGQAVVDLIRNCPHDLKLLRLLCQEGKANINFESGLPVLLATRHDNPAILDIVLQSEGGPPALDTIGNALRCIMDLPISDIKRSYKAQAILRGAKPQQALNEALVQEIQAILIDKRDKSMIEILLAAGADVNALEAASICHAVRNQEIMDLLLFKRPKPESLALALPLAMAMGDPERTILCEKLMRAGAVGEQINKALCTAVDEGELGLPMIQILLPQADVNYKNGRVLRLAIKQVFSEAIDLLLAPRPVVASPSTKAVAFQEAMELEVREERHAVIKKLLGAKIPKQVLSDALVPAVNCADYELVELLLQSGAYIDHTNGKSIQSAASSGYRDILKLLVDGKLTSKPSLSMMTSAFGGALTLKEKDADSYYQTIEILLAAGLKGEVVDSALYDAVKEGDSSLQFSRLLYHHGASVEWNHGVIVDLAAKSASIETLRLLFGKPVSPSALRRAYRSSLALPKDQRLEVVFLILDAGMAIDKHVTGTLFRATQENPADHQLIKLLLSHHVFDEGESMAYAVEHLDLDTLALLVESPQAALYTDSAFRMAVDTDSIWQSNLGLSIMETMLEKGAAGPAVSEALLKAIENYKSGPDDRLDLLLRFGADVNHQRGLALQIAAQQVNLDLISKLLPGSSSDSKAMAIPYLFKATSDKATILKILQAFIDSIEDDEQTLDIGFRHPDLALEPVLFMALNSFPRRTQILRALLDMGYSANQWGLYEVDPEVGKEPWPVLCWALSQPEKKISSANIELLIDEGANVTFASKSGITPVTLSITHQRPDILSKLISAGAKITASDPSGITPLALASQSGNTKLMEHLLVAGAEIDDGSLHDAARDLRCDAMRVLVKYGHDPDYPSERHDGRSALAELCLNAVDANPTRLQLEEGVQFLIASSSDFRLRSKPSEHSSGKTIFHHALDSSDPMAIMQTLLKLPLWKVINEDDFLFSDSTHTYSLTKYVTKGLSLGPKSQNEALLHLLQTKRCIPKFYAHATNAPQPEDIINAPPHIVAEITRQRAREKRVQEQKEEALALLDIKRTTAEEEGKILQLRTTHDIRREMELSRAELHLLEQKSQTEIQLLESRSQTEQRLQSERQRLEQEHVRSLGQIQVQNQRAIRHAEIEEDATRELMQLEYLEKKQQREHDAMRQRFAIEGADRQEREKMDKRMHEREAARMKMQRSILDRQQGLAGSIMAGQGQLGNGRDRRQIGYVVGEV